MKNKNIKTALLTLLGNLPKRVKEQQNDALIVVNDEHITVNHLLRGVVNLLDKAIEGKEEEEVEVPGKEQPE